MLHHHELGGAAERFLADEATDYGLTGRFASGPFGAFIQVTGQGLPRPAEYALRSDQPQTLDELYDAVEYTFTNIVARVD